MSDLHFSPRLFRIPRPRFWGNSGIVRRLMLVCLPFPLLILISLFLVTHRGVEENLASAIAQNSYILSQSMGIALSQTLQETRNQIAVLATGSTSFEELRHRIWRRLETLNAMGDARFCEAAFMGQGQLSSKRFLWIRDRGKLRAIPPDQTEIQSSSPFLPPRRQPGEHEVVLSTPTEVSYSFSDSTDKTPQSQVTLQLMRFTAPVTLSDGTFVGYLILSVDIAWLRDSVSGCAISMRRGEKAPLAFFVDNAGWMIFETGPQTSEKEGSKPAVIDSVRSGFQGDFGRAGYSQAFRPGAEYYSYWTMMNHIQKGDAGQFQTSSALQWNREGIPVETVSYAPVTYASGAEGRRDVVGDMVVLDTSFAIAAQRSILHTRYIVACVIAALLLSLSLFCIGLALRKTLKNLGRDIAESTSSALAKPLSQRSAPKEVQEVRSEINRLLDQLRNLEDERDMENTLASARIEVEEVHNMPTEIPVPPDGIIGVSLEMRNLRQNIIQAAKVQADVLVMGETGTGKELVSRAIHLHSANSAGPFMTINCGALDEGLLMDSLFGHVKGAFSEAREARKGAFLTAEGGTLMLDEIGNASPKVQQALLRALSDRRITPLGSDTSVPFNTRVIAATNADLREEIQKGTFREDLYFRLAVITIHTVPLREHKMDIPYLVMFFLRQAREQDHSGRPVPSLSKGALSQLMHYHWPGNVRELSNTIFRTAAFCDGDLILPHHLHLGADSSQADKKAHLRNGNGKKGSQPDVSGREQKEADRQDNTPMPPAVPQEPTSVSGPAPAVPPRGHEDRSEGSSTTSSQTSFRENAASTPAQNAKRDLSAFPRLQKLLPELDRLGEFSRKDYQELAQVSVRTAQYDLQLYVEEGFLERKGRGPSQRYLVKEGQASGSDAE